MVLLADMPLVDAGMIRTLVDRYRAGGAPLVVSDYEGVDAPPILYDRRLFPELRALEGEGCGKRVVKRHSAEAIRIRWPARALTDLDLPDDLERVRSALAGRAMRAELLQLAADLAKRRQPFVLAMVVRRQPYSSAQQGDMAIITADGGYHGWLGGQLHPAGGQARGGAGRWPTAGRGCSRSRPRQASDDRPGVTVLPMVCQSGGTVDVYLEPVLPPPRLVLFGLSPVIRALAQLGKGLGYSVDAVDPHAEARLLPGADRIFVDWASPELRDGGALQRTYAVVATMGEHDEEAVTTALALRPAYLGVVASRTRFGQLREALVARGVAAEPLGRIRNPAGLDIGARLPEEVALSILAEIVQGARTHATPEPPSPPPPTADEALDPVCGMTVVVATARHRAEHAGRTFFFCNPRCREKFLVAPERYLTALPAES